MYVHTCNVTDFSGVLSFLNKLNLVNTAMSCMHSYTEHSARDVRALGTSTKKKYEQSSGARQKYSRPYVEIAIDVTIHDGPIASERSLKL